MTDRRAEDRRRDEDAIRRLVADYGDAITHLDAERAALTYAPDGRVCVVGAETVGRAAIAAAMRRTFEAFQMLQLIAHDGLIEIAGDAARARWSTVEIGVRRGATALSCILGRYEDELVRTDSGWRFGRRVFTLAGRASVDTLKLQVNPAFSTLIAAIAPPREE